MSGSSWKYSTSLSWSKFLQVPSWGQWISPLEQIRRLRETLSNSRVIWRPLRYLRLIDRKSITPGAIGDTENSRILPAVLLCFPVEILFLDTQLRTTAEHFISAQFDIRTIEIFTALIMDQKGPSLDWPSFHIISNSDVSRWKWKSIIPREVTVFVCFLSLFSINLFVP